MAAAASSELVLIDERHAPIFVVTINRAHVKNAVDRPTAHALHRAFVRFATDDRFAVAILQGAGGTFCAGADLTAAFDELDSVRQQGAGASSSNSANRGTRSNDLSTDMDAPGPMGVTRMQLPKPVIASIEGYALAGGLELAAWCDLRVASEEAVLGVTCRTRGVPLIDGGTVRLPALLGQSRAMDLILTGRNVSAQEAERMGLVNVLVRAGQSTFDAALALARTLASKPQLCMQHDRLSVYGALIEQKNLVDVQPAELDGSTSTERQRRRCPFAVQGALRDAMALEFQHGLISLTALGTALEEFVKRQKSRL